MTAVVPAINFRSDIQSEFDAEEVLRHSPARSYVVWQVPESTNLTLSYVSIFKQEARHSVIARDDKYYWFPSALEPQRFRRLEDLLASRRYIDHAFILSGAENLAPRFFLPVALVRKVMLTFAGESARRLALVLSVLLLASASALFFLNEESLRSAAEFQTDKLIATVDELVPPIYDLVVAAQRKMDVAIRGAGVVDRDPAVEAADIASASAHCVSVYEEAKRRFTAFEEQYTQVWSEGSVLRYGSNLVLIAFAAWFAFHYLLLTGFPGSGFPVDAALARLPPMPEAEPADATPAAAAIDDGGASPDSRKGSSSATSSSSSSSSKKRGVSPPTSTSSRTPAEPAVEAAWVRPVTRCGWILALLVAVGLFLFASVRAGMVAWNVGESLSRVEEKTTLIAPRNRMPADGVIPEASRKEILRITNNRVSEECFAAADYHFGFNRRHPKLLFAPFTTVLDVSVSAKQTHADLLATVGPAGAARSPEEAMAQCNPPSWVPSIVEEQLAGPFCSWFVVQTTMGVPRSTVVITAIMMSVTFIALLIREFLVDRAGLGLTWRPIDDEGTKTDGRKDPESKKDK